MMDNRVLVPGIGDRGRGPRRGERSVLPLAVLGGHRRPRCARPFHCAGSDRSGALHLTSPPSGFPAAALDEFLESLEIAADAMRDYTHGIADILGDTFRVVLELKHDPGAFGREMVERDHPGVRRPA